VRLFIATPIEVPFFNELKDATKPYIVGSFTKEKNLHLTHLFIGKADINNYKFKLNIPNEEISIKDFSFFGEKILYLKAYSPNIDAVYKELKAKGLAKEQKPFIPHVTVARIKEIKNKKALLKALEPFRKIEIKSKFSLYLYSSTLTPNGPIYKQVYKY